MKPDLEQDLDATAWTVLGLMAKGNILVNSATKSFQDGDKTRAVFLLKQAISKWAEVQHMVSDVKYVLEILVRLQEKEQGNVK